MITTNDAVIADSVRSAIANGGYTSKRKLAKEALTGLAMFMATHPAIYWATVHPAVVLGNKLGQDPIHERFGEPECTYDSVPNYYFEKGRALAVQAAVGLKQLDRIESLNGSRRKNGHALDRGLIGTSDLELPDYPEGSEPIYMSFVVHHDNEAAR